MAGLAAAEALSRHGLRVTVLEARRQLGGRAGSFCDPATEEWVDHCQHVAMHCCTNLADFCRQTQIARYFRHDRVVHFFGPDGRRSDLQAAHWLPAPLHLAPWLMRVDFLSSGEKLRAAKALLKLARVASEESEEETIGSWLRRHGQSPSVLERFWGPVLVSALGEELDRASVTGARKVFVDGFLTARDAHQVLVPTIPLNRLYGEMVANVLRERGVVLRLGAAVSQATPNGERVRGIRLADGTEQDYDFVVLAVPWLRITGLLSDGLAEAVPHLQQLAAIPSAPITGVHLWFDRPLTQLPHAVLVGRLSQWVFNRGPALNQAAESGRHYYQVVISASRSLDSRSREEVLTEILSDLQAIWPDTRRARLLQSRIVTQRDAVFSMTPGLERLRPSQKTAVPNLMLAGDWTRTGWPATMEGAVRSGYLAAQAILDDLQIPAQILVPDLPRGRVARWVIGY